MRRRGLTLLEVLLAIALTGGLLSAMFAFLWDILETRTHIARTSQRIDATIALIDGVGQDLVTVIVGDEVLGAGVVGDEASLTLLTRGVPAYLMPDPSLPLADLEEHVYRHEESSGRLDLRRRVVGDDGPGDFLPVGDDIARVRFRYYDGQAWRDAFDSLATDGLPHAVEIAVWFNAPDPRETSVPDDAPLERATFDSAAGFDENAFLALNEVDADDVPPDRVRVIVIPDAIAPASPNDPVEEGEP